MSANGTSVSEVNTTSEKRFSRVSRLRDMFQKGDIRPIEELDNFEAYVSPPFANLEDPSRLLRTLPGSPPLSALRQHRSIISKETGENNSTVSPSKYRPESVISHTNGLAGPTATFGSSNSSCTAPPARPPKPRNLCINKSSPIKSVHTPMKPKISSQLRKSIALFENGAAGLTSHSADKEERPDLNGPFYPAGCATACPGGVPVAKISLGCDHERGPVTSLHSSTEVTTDSHVKPDRSASKHPEVTLTDALNSSRQISLLPDGTDRRDEDRSRENNLNVHPVQNRLSSWQASTALDRIEPTTTESTAPQDFILESDAFRVSPQFLDSSNLEDSLPALQHAEPIAVASPDEDEDDDDDEGDKDPRFMYRLEDSSVVSVMPVAEANKSSEPIASTLPVPPGLKVVAVDFQGVHILEDGNFFYSVPGLSSRPQSPEYSDLMTRSNRPGDQIDNRGSGSYIASDLSALSAAESVPAADMSLLADTSTDNIGRQPRVRFSTDPIVVFSTHSTSEYNRRNDDIDPLAASAEYELEKHLEEMELVNVDLKKGPQGLGISILGLGVDNIGGHQKLGIFIKSLTPGGAAEADGRIQVFDQIVEVDGQSLVGVSQKFAAQTLRNTQDIVHFVLAREQDPANSRVAQLLAEQEEEERMREAHLNALNEMDYDPNKTLSVAREK